MTKPIIVVKISGCKLLYMIQVNRFSWPYLISKILVAHNYSYNAASDWPRTFFTARLYLFSILSTGLGGIENFISQYIVIKYCSYYYHSKKAPKHIASLLPYCSSSCIKTRENQVPSVTSRSRQYFS